MSDTENSSLSALQQLVSEVNHPGKSQYVGLLFPVPTRLQLESYAMVEALTHHAATTRNKLMNQLVDVGIEATLSQLPDDVFQKLQAHAQSVITRACEKNAGLLERGEA